VILVAISTRRHLVREFFSEREEGLREGGEVRGQDTVEEKLSLSDRFGLVVSFYTPNQDIYLQIVDQWARIMGIELPEEELHARAILWARKNNGPSGRTARQFINDLKGRVD
jgi:predicted AAA+ superfamily ATPase